ncbi:hypothetical protein A3H16_00320 [Candidatus Kaiserbacteria bacterium RIFCSPLOWO2_12_FULL_53_8]|uniref:Dockerin domain-containing protein n=1 Tax=Candidatus Kaiserbacteria bacterium RIFCSPLOWO2_12_FULL_53_8 TaxID=1798529 RepID=A0A1F6G0N9_9BACT|nr:MAG: hypothetical protein A3H16_00320 [Candidatus Kaiserbacteria bacterium RIFCSPLOWO2_12_FULL_53_8]
MGIVFVFFVCITLMQPLISTADDISSTNFQILTPTIVSGGLGTSSSYSLIGMIFPFSEATSSASSFSLNPGFLAYPFVSTPVVSATAGDAQVSLSWTAATGYLGWTASGYTVGQSTSSGGPYTFTSVGNVLLSTRSSLTNGTTYYFVIRVLDAFSNVIATSTQVSGLPAGSESSNNTTSGGGGGGASPISAGATASFSGRAFPNSSVVLLKDGQIALSTVAGGDARFQFSLGSLSAGSYVFSVYGSDKRGNRSAPLSFPVTLTAGASTEINGIFISPTIDVDKSEVRRGDNISLFGQAAASSTVAISIHSNPEIFVRTTSDDGGAYAYTFDTSILDLGSHLAKSKAVLRAEASEFGAAVGFAVGEVTKLKESKSENDLNQDGRVNLIDFSIMSYWYQRPLAGDGLKIDLNHDGKVDLVDFSILMYHWTG